LKDVSKYDLDEAKAIQRVIADCRLPIEFNRQSAIGNWQSRSGTSVLMWS
jgi:hypothetical protein